MGLCGGRSVRDLEPAFSRLRAEHRVIRAVLAAVDQGERARARRLAPYVEAVDEHAAFEEDVLFPYLRRRVPRVGDAIDHAEGEHDYLRWHLTRLVSALRAGRRYDGPVIAALRHHFEEEEADIVAPTLAAGVVTTPRGTPGRLLALHDALVARCAA